MGSSETQAGGRTSEVILEGGPFRALQTERIACKCPEARRKVADKRTERRQWGWGGVEAEGGMDHRRLEESPPHPGPASSRRPRTLRSGLPHGDASSSFSSDSWLRWKHYSQRRSLHLTRHRRALECCHLGSTHIHTGGLLWRLKNIV